jgi:uncharacterized membrane protein
MKGMIAVLLMSLGGWLGWAAGAWLSIWVALVLSCTGTAVGLYAARRFNANYLP